MTKIAVFYGGKISKHLVLIRAAARKLGEDLDLVSYNRVNFETETGKVGIKDGELEKYDVLFFRTTGKHWEEVDLILKEKKENQIVVDPMVEEGKASQACKAWQMLKLKEAGIAVPKTVYGSLWYLYDYMKKQEGQKRPLALPLNFPVILKGSGGDRGTRVYKANNLEELEKLVRDLRKSETEDGRRYMLQEFIPNEGDYRVLVLGKKVLGVMKRSRTNKSEFRNNFSVGGKVEVSDLPEKVKEMAVRAAEVCGLMVAGVDVIPSGNGYLVLEVNKGPQFWGFMKATGINVPEEIVKFLVSLKDRS